MHGKQVYVSDQTLQAYCATSRMSKSKALAYLQRAINDGRMFAVHMDKHIRYISRIAALRELLEETYLYG